MAKRTFVLVVMALAVFAALAYVFVIKPAATRFGVVPVAAVAVSLGIIAGAARLWWDMSFTRPRVGYVAAAVAGLWALAGLGLGLNTLYAFLTARIGIWPTGGWISSFALLFVGGIFWKFFDRRWMIVAIGLVAVVWIAIGLRALNQYWDSPSWFWWVIGLCLVVVAGGVLWIRRRGAKVSPEIAEARAAIADAKKTIRWAKIMITLAEIWPYRRIAGTTLAVLIIVIVLAFTIHWWTILVVGLIVFTFFGMAWAGNWTPDRVLEEIKDWLMEPLEELYFDDVPTPPIAPEAPKSMPDIPTPPPADDEERPVSQFVTTYELGDNRYDMSFAIEKVGADLGSDFLGECGVAISETIGTGDPDKVTALEVWLFDKNDVRTTTKVLMSEFCFGDITLRGKLAEKGEAIMIRPGEIVVLDKETLRLRACVIDMAYGSGELPSNSFFEWVKLEISVWQKNASGEILSSERTTAYEAPAAPTAASEVEAAPAAVALAASVDESTPTADMFTPPPAPTWACLRCNHSGNVSVRCEECGHKGGEPLVQEWISDGVSIVLNASRKTQRVLAGIAIAITMALIAAGLIFFGLNWTARGGQIARLQTANTTAWVEVYSSTQKYMAADWSAKTWREASNANLKGLRECETTIQACQAYSATLAADLARMTSKRDETSELVAYWQQEEFSRTVELKACQNVSATLAADRDEWKATWQREERLSISSSELAYAWELTATQRLSETQAALSAAATLSQTLKNVCFKTAGYSPYLGDDSNVVRIELGCEPWIEEFQLQNPGKRVVVGDEPLLPLAPAPTPAPTPKPPAGGGIS